MKINKNMTCEHINEARTKIKNIVDKMADPKSRYYKDGSHMSLQHIQDVFRESEYEIMNFCEKLFKDKSRFINVLDGCAIFDDLKGVSDGLKNCNCCNNKIEDYNKLVAKYNNLSKENGKNVNDYNELLGKKKVLEEKYNKLVDDYNDKNSDYHDMKEKFDDTNEKLHSEKLKHANESGNEKLKHSGEKSQLQIQNTRLQEKLEATNSEKLDLRRRLTDKESENDRLLIKLDDKNNQLTVLRIESGKKDSDLERKSEEIRNLKNQAKSSDKRAEKTQEELLTEKIRSEKSNLELFATELRVGLEQTNGLIRYHERLFRARKDYNQVNVETHENNITRIKEELQNAEISIVNIQEICRKCEKIAELR
jgi:hypothetical protein